MKFSIIIPVYNVEKYIEKCLNSVVNQLFKDFEIIIVNDGSTDMSPIICETYAKKYHFIQLLNKENEGLSMARNDGVRAAKGKYIIFLDSDDYWIDENVLKNIYAFTSKNICDLYVFEYNSLNCIDNCMNYSYRFPIEGVIETTVGLRNLLESNLYKSNAWSKVVSRKLILDNDIYFIKGIRSEDIEWSLRILLKSKKIGVIKIPVLVYLQCRSGAITTTVNKEHCKDYIDTIELCCKYAKGEDDLYLTYIGYQYIILMGHVAKHKDLLNEAKKYQFLLKKNKIKKVRVVRALVLLIGFNNTCKLLNKYLNNYGGKK